MATKSKKASATVKTTSVVRPKRPKVDRGEAFEQIVRSMFKIAVDLWCKDNLDEQPSKDVRGNVVDNLTATWTSAIETTVDAATDSYLSTVSEDDDEDDDEDDEDDGDGDVIDGEVEEEDDDEDYEEDDEGDDDD